MAITIDYTPEETSRFRTHAEAHKISIEEFIHRFSVKALHNAEYLSMLHQSERELQQGKVITKTMEELEAMARE